MSGPKNPKSRRVISTLPKEGERQLQLLRLYLEPEPLKFRVWGLGFRGSEFRV